MFVQQKKNNKRLCKTYTYTIKKKWWNEYCEYSMKRNTLCIFPFNDEKQENEKKAEGKIYV